MKSEDKDFWFGLIFGAVLIITCIVGNSSGQNVGYATYSSQSISTGQGLYDIGVWIGKNFLAIIGVAWIIYGIKHRKKTEN